MCKKLVLSKVCKEEKSKIIIIIVATDNKIENKYTEIVKRKSRTSNFVAVYFDYILNVYSYTISCGE